MSGAGFLFAGGGTGGHLYPALAIADEVRRRLPEARIIFVGTAGKIESRVVPAHGYPIRTIWIAGFRRSLSPELLTFPLKVLVALMQSILLLRRERPDVVVGTGGYVCGPVGFAAGLLGLPLVLQEQNSLPGATIRLLARRATQVHVTFESTRHFLRRTDNVSVSGNPTRDEIGSKSRAEGAAFFGLDPEKTTLLVFGGSLGAASINSALLNILDTLREMDVQVLWQTGETDFARVQEAVAGRAAAGWLRVVKFIDRMEYAYAACDLAVCRAGATTLAELMRSGTPALLVPYPFAAADHQTVNATTMVEAGAALLCPDRDLSGRLAAMLAELIRDRDRLRAMSRKARSLGRPDAAAVIAGAVITLARSRHDGS